MFHVKTYEPSVGEQTSLFSDTRLWLLDIVKGINVTRYI